MAKHKQKTTKQVYHEPRCARVVSLARHTFALKEDEKGGKSRYVLPPSCSFGGSQLRNTRFPLWEGSPEASRAMDKNVNFFFPPLSNFHSQRLLIISTTSYISMARLPHNDAPTRGGASLADNSRKFSTGNLATRLRSLQPSKTPLLASTLRLLKLEV